MVMISRTMVRKGGDVMLYRQGKPILIVSALKHRYETTVGIFPGEVCENGRE